LAGGKGESTENLYSSRDKGHSEKKKGRTQNARKERIEIAAHREKSRLFFKSGQKKTARNI